MFPRDIDQQKELMYNEQVKTNELLTQLIALSQPKPIQKTTVTKPVNKTKTKPRGKVK